MKTLIILSSVLFLTGCFDSDAQEKEQEKAAAKETVKISQPSFSENKKLKKSANLGQSVFDKNCIACHGQAGEGLTKDWKKRNADGKFPAPPVNGTAHAWHHSPKALMTTINDGGAKLGGWMPSFKDQLNEAEKQGLLDYIHSLWPNEIQQKYDSRFK